MYFFLCVRVFLALSSSPNLILLILNVIPVSFLPEQLSLLIRPVNGSALVGDKTYVIDCQITGVPPATSISWHKQYTNDENQHPIIPSSKYTVTAHSNTPVLTISDIAETDEGDYFCSATNLAGTVTSTRSRLIVKEGKSI